MPRTRTVLIGIVAIATVAVLWQKNAPQPSPQNATSGRSPVLPEPAATSKAAATADRGSAPASSGTDTLPASPSPGMQTHGVTTSTGTPAPPAPNTPVRLDVRAPASARVGDRIAITIDAEAFGGIQKLSFVVSYDDRVLAFVSSTPGSFLQQASAPASLSAEDPSTSGVVVSMRINDGGVVAAAGTVVVLEFNVLQAGTSPITLRDVRYLERGGSSGSTAATVRPASVTIEQG